MTKVEISQKRAISPFVAMFPTFSSNNTFIYSNSACFCLKVFSHYLLYVGRLAVAWEECHEENWCNEEGTTW